MIVGSTKEDLSIENRVALTPESAKNIIGLGLNIYLEKGYASHLGITDKDYSDVGVEIKNSYEILSRAEANHLMFKLLHK